MTEDPEFRNRQLKNLEHDLSIIAPYLEREDVTDICLNSNRTLFIHTKFQGWFEDEKGVDPAVTRRIIKAVASYLGKVINYENPELQGIIPIYEARIHAFVEPLTIGPSIAIRLPTRTVYTMDDYLRDERMDEIQYSAILRAINERKNIVVCGPTGSGKTTLTNAILDSISDLTPDDRLYIVEDAMELVSKTRNCERLKVTQFQYILAVQAALRYFPKRVIFGELRHGAATLELLKVWQTGHPGLTTIHSEDAKTALLRFVSLVGEASVNVDKTLISTQVNIIIYIARTKEKGPVVREVLEVLPDLSPSGGFQYKSLGGHHD